MLMVGNNMHGIDNNLLNLNPSPDINPTEQPSLSKILF